MTIVQEKVEKPDETGGALQVERDGGVYLLIADTSSSFEAALRRVTFLAKQNNGHVALLYVIEDEGYLHWANIAKQIEKDKRAEAEAMLLEIAHRLNTESGITPAFYIKQGKTRQEIMNILNTDAHLRALVLGASSSGANPLVSYFTGKGLSQLHVPLVIVPEKLY